jgi:hypothetical protein
MLAMRLLRYLTTRGMCDAAVIIMNMMRIAILVAAFVAILKSQAVAEPDVVTVDVYGNFNINNPPSAGPYSGFAGQYYLTASDLENGYNFGTPFGLTSFVAVLSFTEYVSVTGLYIPYLDTSNGYTSNLYDGLLSNGPGPYSLGSVADEIQMSAGFNSIQFDYIAGEGLPDGSLGNVGGPPYLLTIDFPQPWGGDPDVWNSQTYLVPVSVAVPDLGSTLSLVGGALAGIAALRLRLATDAEQKKD